MGNCSLRTAAGAGAACPPISGVSILLRPRLPDGNGMRTPWVRHAGPSLFHKHKRPTLSSEPLRKSRNRGGTEGTVHTAGISFSGKEGEFRARGVRHPLCERPARALRMPPQRASILDSRTERA
jgi:hypothetical protein